MSLLRAEPEAPVIETDVSKWSSWVMCTENGMLERQDLLRGEKQRKNGQQRGIIWHATRLNGMDLVDQSVRACYSSICVQRRISPALPVLFVNPDTHVTLGADADSTFGLLVDAAVPSQPALLVEWSFAARNVLDIDLVSLLGPDGGSGPEDEGLEDGRVGRSGREDRGDVQVTAMRGFMCQTQIDHERNMYEPTDE